MHSDVERPSITTNSITYRKIKHKMSCLISVSPGEATSENVKMSLLLQPPAKVHSAQLRQTRITSGKKNKSASARSCCMIWRLCGSFVCKCSRARLVPALCLSPGVAASPWEGESIKLSWEQPARAAATPVRQKKCCSCRLCYCWCFSTSSSSFPLSVTLANLCAIFANVVFLSLWRMGLGPLHKLQSNANVTGIVLRLVLCYGSGIKSPGIFIRG